MRTAGSSLQMEPSRPKSSSRACGPPSARISSSRPVPGLLEPRFGSGRDRNLRGPVGPDSTQLAPGPGRGHSHREHLGQQRDNRQEPLPYRSRRGSIRPRHRSLCDGRGRPIGINHRRGLRRPLPDRRKRPASGRIPRVGDGGPLHRDSYSITQDVDVAKLVTDRQAMTSCGWLLRKLASRFGGSRSRSPNQWRASSVRCRALPSYPEKALSFIAAAPRSSASSARGWPTHRMPSPRHSTQHRHFGRSRFHARSPGRRRHLRHARHRPPVGPWPHNSRLRHDRTHPHQRPGTHANTWAFARKQST